MVRIEVYLWVLATLVHVTIAEKSCSIVEEKLDIVYRCERKGFNDDDYRTVFQSIENSQKEPTNPQLERKIHVMLDENEIRVLKRIPSLMQVSKISFKHNQIIDVESQTFQNLPQLKSLDLSYNNLTGENLTSDIFRGVEEHDRFQPLQLEHLNLSNNLLTYLKPDLFKYLPNLKSLELSNNPINTINRDTERAIHSLRKLQVLFMSNVGISTVPNMLFETIPVVTLFLNQNNFVRIPRSISESSSVKYLNLNDNPIEEINSSSFAKLMRLQELHINGMHNLTRITENAFTPLINLEILKCSFNPKLEFIHPKAFGRRNNRILKELYLNNNALQSLYKELLDWKKLDVLELRGNPWNCSCSLQWLFQLLQHRDPELNLQIMCQHPASMYKRPLFLANNYLRCSDISDPAAKRIKPIDLVLWAGAIVVLCVALQLAYLRFIRYRTKRRHPGTSIKSTVKYRSARSTIYL